MPITHTSSSKDQNSMRSGKHYTKHNVNQKIQSHCPLDDQGSLPVRPKAKDNGYGAYALWNKNVFSLLLKQGTEGELRMFIGKAFHICGAIYSKLLFRCFKEV